MESFIMALGIVLAIPGAIISIFQIKKMYSKKNKKQSTEFPMNIQETEPFTKVEFLPEEKVMPNTTITHYSNQLQLSSLNFPYIPFIASWSRNENEYRVAELHISLVESNYKVKEDFIEHSKGLEQYEQDYINHNITEPKVRLEKYNIIINPGTCSNDLRFWFSKTYYRDYLLTNDVLDDPLSNDTSTTFREKYFSKDSVYQAENGVLSNICGVGVFIITADDKIILTKASPNVKVNPNLIGYSASGTMDWNERLNPFDEVIRECKEEIGYQIDIDNLLLFSFGMDTLKAYYQFSFYEVTSKTSEEIINDATQARDFAAEISKIYAIDFDYKAIIESITKEKWDDVSAATLITLCTKFFGKKVVEEYIDPGRLYQNYKTHMQTEWERRAKREGKLAVLSNRFPIREINAISDNYLNSVLSFIGNDFDSKSIIEVGCGIGLMTKKIIGKVDKLTCVDISKLMIERNKEYLGKDAIKIHYVNEFFQDFTVTEKYDALMCSLVMIHNTNPNALSLLVANMKKATDTIFLFEQLDTGIQASSYSEAKTLDEYKRLFREYKVERIMEYSLFVDKMVFLKFSRK